jgi:hypothetical protein
MKRFKQIVSLLFVMAAMGSAHGATIFSDDFSDSSASGKLKWILLGQNTTVSYTGGVLTVKNDDVTFTSFLIHNFSGAKPTTFTLSAQVTEVVPATFGGSGIMYCVNSTTGITGYSLQIGNSQSLYVYKFPSASGLPIFNKPTSSMMPTTNIIKVSKSGNLFNTFCNGIYVQKFNDNTYTGGDIALVVPSKSTYKFDNVVMTDQYEPPVMPTCFADSFPTTDEQGWNTTNMMHGTATFGAGALVLNNTDTMYSSIIYNDAGDYSHSSMKAVVTSTAGTGMYGVTFVADVQTAVKTFAFVISPDRRYSIVYPDSPSVSMSNPLSFIKGSFGKDTLEVIRYATKYAFVINGNDVGVTISVPAAFNIEGAGLYVGRKTSATYNYFMVGGDSTGAKCLPSSVLSRRNVYNKIVQPVFGKGCIVYDIMGRKIGAYDELSFARAKLARGLYFVVPAGASAKNARPIRMLQVKN